MVSTRARLLDAIRQAPGIHKSQLCDVAGTKWSTASYHLERLQKQGLIRTQVVGKRLMIYPETMGFGDAMLLRARRDPVRADILDQLHQGPVGLTELARRSNVTRKVMRRHLSTLMRVGLVHRAPGHRGSFMRMDLASSRPTEPADRVTMMARPDVFDGTLETEFRSEAASQVR